MWGNLEDQGEGRQALHEGGCEVSQSVDREMISRWRGWDWGTAVQGEVEGGEDRVRVREGSLALKADNEGKEGGSQAAAGL